MRFSVKQFAASHAHLIVEPENQAEKYQLLSVIANLKRKNALVQEWTEIDGTEGISIAVFTQPATNP